MEYAYLKAWTDSFVASGCQVEKLLRPDHGLVILLKNKDALVFVDYPTDCFVYSSKNPGAAYEGKPLWPQLNHASLLDLQIDDNDRIIRFTLENKDIYGQINQYSLIGEFSPRHFNLILCQPEADRMIIKDALVKYSYADNPQRQVLSGLEYQAPSTSFVPRKFEIGYPITFKSLLDDRIVECTSVNSYFEAYISKVLEARDYIQEKTKLQSFWTKELGKLQKKLKAQKDDLIQAEKADTWFAWAEAIKYNLHRLKTGMEDLVTTDYHDPQMPEITVPLLADKSPQDNLNYYIKKYHKAKKGHSLIVQNIERSSRQIDEIKQILARIEAGELIHPPGAARDDKLGHKLDQAAKLLSIRINQDFEVVIGRKAKENDFITTQLARPTDWWFHSRIYHGSHIIIRCLTKKEPPPELKLLCAQLAAWYSKARFSSNVPVDYTQIRFVRKPRKSAPGFVTYRNHQSLYVEPLDFRAFREKLGL